MLTLSAQTSADLTLMNLPKYVSQADLKKQYHKLAKKFHPDLVDSSSEAHKKKAEEHFKNFNISYERLLIYIVERDAMLEKNLKSGALHGVSLDRDEQTGEVK